MEFYCKLSRPSMLELDMHYHSQSANKYCVLTMELLFNPLERQQMRQSMHNTFLQSLGAYRFCGEKLGAEQQHASLTLSFSTKIFTHDSFCHSSATIAAQFC